MNLLPCMPRSSASSILSAQDVESRDCAGSCEKKVAVVRRINKQLLLINPQLCNPVHEQIGSKALPGTVEK